MQASFQPAAVRMRAGRITRRRSSRGLNLGGAGIVAMTTLQ
jgi:hypothetical protein